MITTSAARRILESHSPELVLGEKSLSEDQVLRAIELAAEEAAEWADDAHLPAIEDIHLDWFLDDLEGSGVTWAAMQRLAFEIARRARARRDEVLAALEEAGYDPASVSGSSVIVYVDTTCDPDDEDYDHSAIPADIASALPEWATARWTGNSQTHGDGSTTSDLAITWTNED